MTKDDIFRIAGETLTEMGSRATVVAVDRAPDKPFGWSISIDGDEDPPRTITLEHAGAKKPEAEIREAIRERLKGPI